MRLVLILFSLSMAISAFAQNKVVRIQPWSILAQKRVNNLANNTSLQFQLNYKSLAQKLIHTPSRNRYKNKPTKTIVSFPLPNGTFQRFLIEEANNFHASLAKRFPNIQAYAGTGIDDPAAVIRFSFSPKGLTGIIQSNQYGTILLDPIHTNTSSIYQVQSKKNLGNRPFDCKVKEFIKSNNTQPANNRSNPVNCELRKYRFALGCTGEFAQYHGGTVEDALIAMNNTLTVVNGIFENDLAISLELIPNTTDLIYLNGESDPYSNTELTEMLGENQTVCDTKIGIENYDIGHVFGTGLGGVAFLGTICQENFKASGASGFPQPEGPIFAIDLVAHELGHQFGAAHTFNGNQVACAGSNRSNESAVEPGSGSTIMAYAGICSPQNVQDNSDAYFHAVSLQQMNEVINNSDCGVQSTGFENTAPVIIAANSSYHIPISTPFALSMNATDVGNNELTYTWEQMDAGIGAIPPLSTNEEGPMFRSILPANKAIRYFPNLPDLSKNISPTWEVLPSVERTMNFRGTVRDNQTGGGCYELQDVEVNVVAGNPFQISYPNTKESWQAGTEQTILWEVGNTIESPINTQTVAILLSTDGGLTFPTTLKERVPNTGDAVILVPNLSTSGARIMVKAEGNIYFDLSNENFTITKPVNDFEVTVMPNLGVCNPSAGIFEIKLDETGNFKAPLELKVTGLPVGVVAEFSNANPVVPAEVILSISNLENLTGSYDFNLIAIGSTGEKTRGLRLNIANSPPQAIALITPMDKEQTVGAKPTFSWRKDTLADFYQLEIATDLSFVQSIFVKNKIEKTTCELDLTLNNNTQYFWRVRAENSCGTGNYSEIFTFQTLNEKCTDFSARDLPVTIPSIFGSTVSSTISIPANGKLTSIQIENLKIAHSFIADLIIDLESPSGARVRLLEEICFLQEDLELNFSDAANILNEDIPCPPFSQLPVQPLEQLNQLIGSEVNGDWQLIVRDNAILDGGRIEQWDLSICYETPAPLAIAANRIGVSCAGGNDGVASVAPNGGTGTYTYSWSNGATSSIIQDLFAGAYSVTIFDGLISMDTTLFIEEPRPLKIADINTTDGCVGARNGAIEILPEGGTPDYQFIWSDGRTTANLMDLTTGLYTVTVTDKIGCQVIDSVELNVSEPLDIWIDSLVNPICSIEETGGAFITNASNTPTFYNWSNGFSGQNQFNLPIGNYSVYAIDVNGCEDTLALAIYQEEDTTAPTLILQSPIIYLDEEGRYDLSAAAFDAGSFDDCSEVRLSLNQTEFDCQKIGHQTVEIIGVDAVGNERKMEIDFQIIDTIPPTLIFHQPTIYLDKNGVATLDENLLDAGSFDNCGAVTLSLSKTTFDCENKGAQVVELKGIDENGNEKRIDLVLQIMDTIAPVFDCMEALIFFGCTEITSADFPAASDNCEGVNISLVEAGGIGYSTDSTVLTFRATDKNGNHSFCYVPFKRENNFKIETNAIPPLCMNDRGAASVIPIGGIAPYQFLWNDEFAQTSSSALGLPVGNYMVSVTDDSGCNLVKTVEIPGVNPIELIDIEIQSEINRLANGSIKLQAIGGTGVLKPVWFKGDSIVGTTFNLMNLSAGIYTLNITDEHDCRFSQDFSIDFLTSNKEFYTDVSIHIFPNPSNGRVVVKVDFGNKKDYSMQIMDRLGRRVMINYQKGIKEANEEFDLSHLDNGLYFINFMFEEGIISRKILLVK